MFRFFATLVLTVVGMLAAAAWWSGRQMPGVLPVPGQAVQAEQPAPEKPKPAAAVAAPVAVEPAPVLPAPEPVPPPRVVPPIPAPRLADLSEPPARTVPAVPAPVGAPPAEATVEDVYPLDPEAAETLVSEPLAFDEDDLPLEPSPEEQTVAMRGDHDESADLIRRLLDVYESLGRRR